MRTVTRPHGVEGLGRLLGWFAGVTAIIVTANVFGLGISATVSAQEVILFNSAPPSSDELANIMFPSATRDQAPGAPEFGTANKTDRLRIRMRGIRPISREPAESAQTVAKTFAKQVALMINFRHDSTEIVPESRPYLDRVAGMMKMDRIASNGIIIEGHADATGSEEYNQRLSERRAEAIKRYLVETHAIEPHRLITMGKGESAPLVREDPNHPANRRAQFRQAY